jgi:hypothetical protein
LQSICTLRIRIVWFAVSTFCTSPLWTSHIFEQPPGAFCARAGAAASTANNDRRTIRTMR